VADSVSNMNLYLKTLNGKTIINERSPIITTIYLRLLLLDG